MASHHSVSPSHNPAFRLVSICDTEYGTHSQASPLFLAMEGQTSQAASYGSFVYYRNDGLAVEGLNLHDDKMGRIRVYMSEAHFFNAMPISRSKNAIVPEADISLRGMPLKSGVRASSTGPRSSMTTLTSRASLNHGSLVQNKRNMRVLRSLSSPLWRLLPREASATKRLPSFERASGRFR